MKNEKHLNREKRRENALPPFLMVRSGLLDAWIVPAVVTALAAGIVTGTQNFHSNSPLADVALATLIFITVCYGTISTERKRKLFKQDIETIKREFAMYIKHQGYPLDLVGTIYSQKLAKILIEHIVKRNPGIFDKMIQNPDSVMDPETRSNIISGYLKTRPDVADKVVNTFKAGEIDPKVYNKALKYSNRLRDYEKQR